MSDNLSETRGADVGESVYRWRFDISRNMQRGDFYMGRSLEILFRIFPMIGPLDQKRLREMYTWLVQTTQV